MYSEYDIDRITDYIYLLEIHKLSEIGLYYLFKNPNITILKLKNIHKDTLTQLLMIGKDKTLLQYSIVDTIKSFDYTDEKYITIRDMVKECFEKNIEIYFPGSVNYPRIFDRIPIKYRKIIYYKGYIADIDLRSYSICGTRKPTKDAMRKTMTIAEYFAKKKYTLINGFAKGIDTYALLGCAKGNGRYIGVLGSGLEKIYPPENKTYIPYVMQSGALISQLPINERGGKDDLRMRNRLTALLSIGSIFIEGTYRSGTIWQFRFAKEFGQPIFYLEPKDWSHPNAYIPKLIRYNGGIEIKNDLSNLDEIEEKISTYIFGSQ